MTRETHTSQQSPRASFGRTLHFAVAAVLLVFLSVELLFRLILYPGIWLERDFVGRKVGGHTLFVGMPVGIPYFVPDKHSGLWVPNRTEMSRYTGLPLEALPDHRRLAIFGGSSVATEAPDGPAWQLLALLKLGSSHPVELVNAGGDGFGSTRVSEAMQELLKRRLNAVVVYCGHNEFMESRFVPQLRLDSRLYRTLGWLRQHWLLYRFSSQLWSQWWSPELEAAEDVPGGRLVEGELARLEARFEQNLIKMAESARAAGVKSIWIAPASNLWLAPEMSGPSKPMSKGALEQLDQMMGMAARCVDGLEACPNRFFLRQALERDPLNAALWYHHGRLLTLVPGLEEEALEALRKARDLDQTPKRMTRPLVEIMKRVGAAYRIQVIDAEAVLLGVDRVGYLHGAFSADLMHLSGRGYREVMKAVYPHLEEVMGGLQPLERILGLMPDVGAPLDPIIGPRVRTVRALTVPEVMQGRILPPKKGR